MNGTSCEFLASAALSRDEDRAFTRSDGGQDVQGPSHAITLRDDVAERVRVLEGLSQVLALTQVAECLDAALEFPFFVSEWRCGDANGHLNAVGIGDVTMRFMTGFPVSIVYRKAQTSPHMLALKISLQGRPIASERETPVISSAARLKQVMCPAASIVKTPSVMLLSTASNRADERVPRTGVGSDDGFFAHCSTPETNAIRISERPLFVDWKPHLTQCGIYVHS